MLKRKRIGYLAIAVFIAAVIIGIKMHNSGDGDPIINTDKVQRGTVTTTVSANGILQPVTTVQVKSNVAGQLVQLAVDEGDTVKAGQLIAKIDPTDTNTALEENRADLAASVSKVDQSNQNLIVTNQTDAAQLESARQALASAQTKYAQAQEQAKSQPALTSSAINAAKSNLAAAQSALKQTKTALIPQKLASAQAAYDQAKVSTSVAEKDVTRQKGLLAKGFVAASVVEASEEKYAAAKAQLDMANNKLQTIRDETDQDLSTAQSKVDQAQASLDNAMANRVQDQLKKQDEAAAKSAVKQAQAALQIAQANMRQDRIKRGDIVQAKAQVTRSEAAVKNALTQLGYTTVTAPRAGVVTKKYADVGSIVTAGKSSFAGSGAGVAIVDIADVSRINAIVNVDETDIAQVEVGQKVNITVEAYPDEPFFGKVTKIAPQSVTDQNVTTIPVTVEVELPDRRLRPGMNVTCDFETGRKDDVLFVPSEAVKEGDNGSTVIVMDKGKQVTRKVETGLVGSDNTEIKSGLREGETVVTSIIMPTAANSTPSGGGGMRPGGFGGPGGMRR